MIGGTASALTRIGGNPNLANQACFNAYEGINLNKVGWRVNLKWRLGVGKSQKSPMVVRASTQYCQGSVFPISHPVFGTGIAIISSPKVSLQMIPFASDRGFVVHDSEITARTRHKKPGQHIGVSANVNVGVWGESRNLSGHVQGSSGANPSHIEHPILPISIVAARVKINAPGHYAHSDTHRREPSHFL